jgi:glycerol-1-phosphate dehydrogenase [NAD(P)+]
VLGRRIGSALRSEGFAIEEIVWRRPRAAIEGVEELRNLSRHCDGLIAVGSGTINDSVKYASFLDKKPFSVFPTSPQLAYGTNTASISFGGFKKSISALPAQGVFFDLSVVSRCPIRLTRSAFADLICRTTALQRENLEAFGVLTRMCALMGMAICVAGSSHPGSMGEHMMSHYIDMFYNDVNPNTLHGEQVGVTSLSMSRLQNQILSKDNPPVLEPTKIRPADMIDRYGEEIGQSCIKELKNKALDRIQAERINRYLAENWQGFAEQLRAVMLPAERLWEAMQAIDAICTGCDLGLPKAFYREVVLYSREVRDRFTMLDIAAHAGMLEAFADDCR